MASEQIEINVVVGGVGSLRDVSVALRSLTASMDENVRSIRNMDARQRALNQALGVTSKGMGEHAKNLGQAVRNQATLSGAIRETTKDLQRLRNEMALGRGGPGLPNLVRDLDLARKNMGRLRAKALVSDLRSVTMQIRKMGKDLQFVGRSLIIGLTTPILGFANKGLSAMYSLEKQLLRVRKIIGQAASEQLVTEAEIKGFRDLGVSVDGSTQRLDAINKVLRQTSMELGISRDALTAITADFAVLGVTSGVTLASLTKTAAEVSLLGTMDLDASQELTQTLFLGMQRALDKRGELFENAAAKQARAAELVRSQIYLFNAVENATSMSFRDISQALPEIAAAVTEFGLSFMEGIALTAPIKAAGIQVSVAANAIKMSMQRLTAPTITARKHMEGLKNQMQGLISESPVLANAFDNIFSTGSVGLQALIDITEAVSNLDQGGAEASAMFSKLFDKRQSTRMKIAIDDMAAFQREMNRGESGAAKLINKFNEWSQAAAASNNTTLPLINSVQTLSEVAKVASAKILPGESLVRIGDKLFNQQQIDAAREARKLLQEEFRERFREGENIIKDISQESGKVLFTQLLGVGGAAELAQAELEVAKNAISTTIDKIKIALKEISITFIDDLKPVLEKIADAMLKLSKSIQEMDPRVRKSITAFAGFVAAIGPLVFILGQAKLATGVLGGTLLRFIPGLRSLTIEQVAGNKGLQRLRRGLTMTGDTVTNTNTRFATMIATLAGGRGVFGRTANMFGRLTGILKKTSTASSDVVAGITQARAASAVGLARVSVPIPTPKRSSTYMDQDARDALRDRIAQKTAARRAAIAQTMTAQGHNVVPNAVFGGGFVARGLRGRFQKLTPAAAAAVQGAVQDDQEQRLLNLATRDSVRHRFMRRRGVAVDPDAGTYAFRGRAIDQKTAETIGAGGMAGRMTRARLAVSGAARTATAPVAAVGKVATAPIRGFVKSINNAKTAVTLLKAEKVGFGKAAPGIFAKAGAAVRGFIPAVFSLSNAFKLLRVALIKTGIGAIIIGFVALIAIFVKNWDQVKVKAVPILDALKESFEAIKRIFKSIIELFAGFFSALGAGGGEGSDAMQGIGAVMEWVAGAITTVSEAVETFVNEKLIPGLSLAFGFVINFANGIKDLVKAFIAMHQGAEDAMEQVKEAFSNIWTAIVSFVAGVIAPALIDIIAAAVKIIIKIFFSLVQALPNMLGILVNLWLNAVGLIIKLFVSLVVVGLKIWARLPGGVMTIASKIYGIFADMIDNVTKKFQDLPLIGHLFKGAISGYRMLGSGLDTASEATTNFLVNQANSLGGFLNDKAGEFKDWLGDVGNGAMGLGKSISDGIAGGLDRGSKAATSWVDSVAAATKDSLRKFRPEGVKAATGFWGSFKKKGSEEAKGAVEDIVDPLLTDESSKAGEDAANAFANKFIETMKGLQQKFVDLVLGVLDTTIKDVTNDLVKALDEQREAALDIFEQQLETINKLQKAEESLTRQREYLADRRRMLDERELNRQNYVRNRALAIYEGRIDDARMLDLEERKSRTDSARSIKDLDDKRNRDLARENIEFIKDQINKTKAESDKFFKEQIEAFKDAAKEITKFAPQTIEEYEDQLNQLTELAKKTANENGDAFAETFEKMSETIQTQLPNIGAGVFTENLETLIDIAREKYGLDSPSSNSIVGATVAMLQGVSQSIQSDGVIVNSSMSDILKSLKDDVVDKTLNEINAVFEENNPHTVIAKAIEFANQTIIREFEKTVGHVISNVDDLAKAMDPFINKVVEAQLRLEDLQKAASGGPGGPGGTDPLGGKDWTEWARANTQIPVGAAVPGWAQGMLNTNISGIVPGAPTKNQANQPAGWHSSLTAGWHSSMTAFNNGGVVPAFRSQGVPALLHGGEFVMNSKAVSNIGLAALQSMNNLRFSTPRGYAGSNASTQITETHNYNIYVDNFIGEDQWFEGMMKNYNMKVVPRNQKNAGLQSRTVSTYSGINRGM